MLLEILKAILFGIVEGITEWLPISSTGHMILLDQVVKLNVSADFYKMFQVVIQLGAIMAVVNGTAKESGGNIQYSDDGPRNCNG